MSLELPWYKHILWALRHGEWHWGFESRKKWPEKRYWHIGVKYYDGYWAVLHIGYIYICVNY